MTPTPHTEIRTCQMPTHNGETCHGPCRIALAYGPLFVLCPNCGSRSPFAADEEAAIALHNSAMALLEAARKLPRFANGEIVTDRCEQWQWIINRDGSRDAGMCQIILQETDDWSSDEELDARFADKYPSREALESALSSNRGAE